MTNYNIEVAVRVKEYLDEQGLRYEFKDEIGVILFGVGIGAKINNVRYVISIRQKGIVVNAHIDLAADKKNMSRIERLITLVNNKTAFGCFELDVEDGQIGFKMSHYCENVPTLSEVEFIVDLPAFMFKKYANAFGEILFTDISAEKAYMKTENRDDEDNEEDDEEDKEDDDTDFEDFLKSLNETNDDESGEGDGLINRKNAKRQLAQKIVDALEKKTGEDG